jgi:hypothetical protein
MLNSIAANHAASSLQEHQVTHRSILIVDLKQIKTKSHWHKEPFYTLTTSQAGCHFFLTPVLPSRIDDLADYI